MRINKKNKRIHFDKLILKMYEDVLVREVFNVLFSFSCYVVMLMFMECKMSLNEREIMMENVDNFFKIWQKVLIVEF